MPLSGEDLVSDQYECLNPASGASEFQWRLITKDGPKRFRISGHYESDDGDILTDWALAGQELS